jgi:anti-anti-sigma regulatory factor
LTSRSDGYETAVIEVSHHAGSDAPPVVVVDLKRSSTDDLARLLETAIRAGDVDVIVDLGARADASSDLLTVLHRCARKLRSLGGTLSVVCARPELRRLFDVTLLSQGFRVYRSRDEAFRTWA